jgi:hypothetical protein
MHLVGILSPLLRVKNLKKNLIQIDQCACIISSKIITVVVVDVDVIAVVIVLKDKIFLFVLQALEFPHVLFLIATVLQ